MKKYFTFAFLAMGAVLCFVLFQYRLDMLSYWGDEVGSILYARNDFIPMIRVLLREDVHPPLYYYILHWWMAFWGEGEYALRLLSVIPAVASIFAVYALAQELFGRRTALLTVVFMVVSPEFLVFGRMVRYYSLAVLCATCATYFFVRFLKEGSRTAIAWYVVFATILLYVTYTPLSVLIAHNLILLCGLREYQGLVRKWIAAQIAIFLLYMPCIIMFVMMIVRMAHEGLPPSDFGRGLSGVMVKIAYSLYAFGFGETLFPWRFWLVVPAGIVLLAAFTAAVVRMNKQVFAAVLLLAVPLLFTTAILSTVKTSSSFLYTPSRTLFALPYFYMLAAYGIDSFRARFLKAVAVSVLLIVSAVSIYNYFHGKDYIMPTYLAPWNGVLRDVQKGADPADVVVGEETREFDYYYNREGYRFRFFIDEDEAEKYLTGHPSAKLFYIKTGRDHQPSGLSERFAAWVGQQYRLVSRRGYVPIDGTYGRFKKLLLKREPYRYKMELLVFEK